MISIPQERNSRSQARHGSIPNTSSNQNLREPPERFQQQPDLTVSVCGVHRKVNSGLTITLTSC